ncbi:MAG: 16S rRNA (guanine(527)-N(7))-methyltransferase RsmG [Actinobacteria bacterium]|nr:16S rRNA (guanine(527)-N(7))-methyltransferase RsmG [Actinomycetota bacterium]
MGVEEERLAVFAAAVEESPHNLVSARAVTEIRTRHIPECVALARMLPDGPLRLLDVGSGGGFPGLVIAAVREDLEVTLLDSTRKKTEFLAETAVAMGVDVAVINERAEEAAMSRGGRYDLVTARAVAPLERLIPWTVPFLTASGLVYAVKGDRWEQELDAAAPALRRWGASVVATPADIHQQDDDATADRPKVVIIGRAP